MYCANCGQQLPENAAFCPECGQSVPRGSASGPDSGRQAPPPEPPRITSEEAHIVGSRLEYYAPEFQRIKMGEKCRFNWAAFFLSLYHAAYRGPWREWLSFMKVPLIGLYGGVLVAFIGLMTTNTPAMTVGYAVMGVFSILCLVWAVRYAASFNRIYLDYVEREARSGRPARGLSVLRLIVAALIVFALPDGSTFLLIALL